MTTTKIEFDNISATLCGRMVSSDSATRIQAAKEAATVLAELPKVLRNSPHCRGEIEAMSTLITSVGAGAEQFRVENKGNVYCGGKKTSFKLFERNGSAFVFAGEFFASGWNCTDDQCIASAVAQINSDEEQS